MKVVLLAGGFGTRISEESYLKPKPMIEIGEMPILLHIMKTYSHYGFNEFIICCGYKGYVIKEYFANYFMHSSDMTFDFTKGNEIQIHNSVSEPWVVTLVDTGLNSMTGGRVKQIKPYINPGEAFMLTYGDGVSDVNIKELVKFHESHGKTATLTAVQPSGRFGVLDISKNNEINNFAEKPQDEKAWVNGGYFVLNYEIFDYIKDNSIIFERYPLETLAKETRLMSYKHNGFWLPMDTLRDKEELEKLWQGGNAPWKVW